MAIAKCSIQGLKLDWTNQCMVLCINMMAFQNHPETATKEVQFLVFSELHFKLEVADFKKQIVW